MDALLLKAAARGREVQEKRDSERRRALLVLVLRHLSDQGYLAAAEQLSTESCISLSKVDAADNVGLLQILQDWEDDYEQRYSKRPKLVKTMSNEVRSGMEGTACKSKHVCKLRGLDGICTLWLP